MKILVTQSVIAAKTLFQGLGDIHFIDDQDLIQADLSDVDILIMRSQGKLTEKQLQGSKLKFVGSATAGVDHLPLQALADKDIRLAHAPGCNADSVADYWLSAILYLQTHCGFNSTGKILGLVGYGQVGQRVALRAQALGMQLLINDPPRLAQGLPVSEQHTDLDSLLTQADVLSLHVPKMIDGLWPTLHLLNDHNLKQIKPGIILINTARGDVCDTKAILKAKFAHRILDVWPDEPIIDSHLLQAATLSTPHIAGHSYMGKWQGTYQIYLALMHWLNKASDIKLKEYWLTDEALQLLTEPNENLSESEILWHYVKQIYDVEADHLAMKQWLRLSEPKRARAFSAYRSAYPKRKELSFAKINKSKLSLYQQQVLKAAGVSLC